MQVSLENDCPFCKKSIKEITFFESKNFRAIYNIAPILPGHVLIVPKKHITSFMELTDKGLFEFVKFSRHVILLLTRTFKTEAFNWTLQEKEEAGQTIAHMHIHIIPRKSKDIETPGDWYPKVKNNLQDIIDSEKRPKLKLEELKKIVTLLKETAKECYSELI